MIILGHRLVFQIGGIFMSDLKQKFKTCRCALAGGFYILRFAFYIYYFLIASTGSILEACSAGINPEMIPTNIDAPSPIKILVISI